MNGKRAPAGVVDQLVAAALALKPRERLEALESIRSDPEISAAGKREFLALLGEETARRRRRRLRVVRPSS